MGPDPGGKRGVGLSPGTRTISLSKPILVWTSKEAKGSTLEWDVPASCYSEELERQ